MVIVGDCRSVAGTVRLDHLRGAPVLVLFWPGVCNIEV
ncbi:uncharacterized protein METZ01_LOCUS384041 [marine metagenome]|uniref:Uncharacterized protein n=1 Tax=marine metagenome TaxID=408172 RepID=A0A382UAZ8_9ZZZZ